MKFFPSRKPNKTRSEIYSAEPLRLHQPEQLDRLESETYDILIVDGGVIGAYAALDISLRGYRVALIEKSDFASGTSPKSSKMVHGGLRYIEQGNLGLVHHSLLECQRIRRNARHLVQWLPFLSPVLDKNGVFDKRTSSASGSLLWTYDLADGWREGILHQKLIPAGALLHCLTLKEEQLSGGSMHFNARVDDARLTLAPVRTAAFHGTTVTNHAEVIETIRDQHDKINGAIMYADAREIRIKARVVIIATGVWLRDWNGLEKGETSPLNIRPAKGVHVVIPWMKIRNDCTVTIPVAGRSRRAIITHWGNVSYLDTTDEDCQGDLNDVNCNRTELDFLLERANSALETDLRPEDMVGNIAGCHPLVDVAGGRTVEIKRNHKIRVSADRLVTIVGGKLTTSRHMAEETIDVTSKILGRKKACSTKAAHLLGAAGYDPQAILALGGLPMHLGERYGTEAHFVSGIIQADPSLMKSIITGLPYTEAEVVYAVRRELASTVDDVLPRRIRACLMARDASATAAERVGEIL